MATAGRKPHTPYEKQRRGTFRADRDAQKVELAVPGDPPVAPAYLRPEALTVWGEVLPRAMAAGAVEMDSAALARYCAAEAIVRLKMGAGEMVPAAMLGALRQYEEAFRIVGARSRTGLKPAGPPDNVFRNRGAANHPAKGRRP